MCPVIKTILMAARHPVSEDRAAVFPSSVAGYSGGRAQMFWFKKASRFI